MKVEVEVDAHVPSQTHGTDEDEHRALVRNGDGEPRSLVTGTDPIEVRAPRVEDRRVDEDSERTRFRSAILPRCVCKSPRRPKCSSVITRLMPDRQGERDQFAHRSLKDVDNVYLFADGIHVNVRLRSRLLIAVG